MKPGLDIADNGEHWQKEVSIITYRYHNSDLSLARKRLERSRRLSLQTLTCLSHQLHAIQLV